MAQPATIRRTIVRTLARTGRDPDPIGQQAAIDNALNGATIFARQAATEDVPKRLANLSAAIARAHRALALLKQARATTNDNRRA